MDRLTIQDVNIGFVDNSQLPSYAALYEKLRKYEDLEERGQLLKLPCKVEDMLYILTDDSPTGLEETKCQSIVFYSKNNFVVYAPCQYDDWGSAKWKLKRKDFDKTVFLTKPEAERALAERKSGIETIDYDPFPKEVS